MGLPATDQVEEAVLSKPMAGEEVNEANDNPDTVESELMNKVLS